MAEEENGPPKEPETTVESVQMEDEQTDAQQVDAQPAPQAEVEEIEETPMKHVGVSFSFVFRVFWFVLPNWV